MTETAARSGTEASDTRRTAPRDAWLFAPLLAVLVALPLATVAVTGAGLWYAAHRVDLGLTRAAPTTFAARWPDKSLPTVVIR